MGGIIRFPLERRRRRPRSDFWEPIWSTLPMLPSKEQQRLIEERYLALAKALNWPTLRFPNRMAEHLVSFINANDFWFWPPQTKGDWNELVAYLDIRHYITAKNEHKIRAAAGLGPRLKIHSRKPRDALWAAIWPGLRAIPSLKQERFISALVMEISSLMRAEGQAGIKNPVKWLGALMRRLSPEGWPPTEKAFWGKVCRALKDRRDRLAGKARQRNQRTPEQNRKLWALVREKLGGNREILDDVLRQNFPRAVRKDEHGRLVPSTRALTKREMSELISMLQNPGSKGSGRRKWA